jgi:pimeloyl-ACP methyl ester carboxylesterase
VEGRALAWEMVGYGASIREGWGRDISVAHQAEYPAGWIREIGLDSAVIVGHDLGGGVAQILAVRTPELVRGLVLTNAICYGSWPIPSVKAMRAAGPLVERLPDAIVRFNLYLGLFLRGHDDRVRAKESLAEHWPNYEGAGGAAALVLQARSRDLQDLCLMANFCDITWAMVGQAAQGAGDAELYETVNSLEGQTSTQIKWLKTRMKQAAPQTLLVASS